MRVYFDLNVFDRIEKKDSLKEAEKRIYDELENMAIKNQIVVPYSNAHLNDLFRGFQKNPIYVEGHLANIKKLSKNLCICQYWNRKDVTWHYRDVSEFFEEKKNEWDFQPNSLDELFDGTGLPNLLLPFKLIQLEKNWKLGYKADPMFGVMYPKSKINNTAYSLMEDIYNFQIRLKSDYSLYKSFKNYLIKGISKMNNNKTYSDVLDVFFKYDLKGYKTDGNYNNMFDDSLHTFYAAHCEFFITNDDRCKYKAEKTYERLKIETKVITASEYKEIKEKI